MEIKLDYTRVLQLAIMANDAEGYDEITPFVSAMKKIHEDSKAVGFVNRFSSNERLVLKGIWENIKDNAETTVETNYQEIGKGVQPSGV